MSFEGNPVRVVSGPGVFSRLKEFVPASGRLLLVTTPGFARRGLVRKAQELLGQERLIVFDRVVPNPDLDQLDQALERLSQETPLALIAVGGGSAIDTAKVFSVTIPLKMSKPLDQIFRHGLSQQWQTRIPVVAIPTTAGTGAEVTPFATVWDSVHQKKYSVTGEQVYPELALLDPVLTTTVPRDETLYSALDAISHALESLWNVNRTMHSQGFAMEALKYANRSLAVVLKAPLNVQGRGDLQQAALLAGLAISQTRTAIAHSISYPVTLRYAVPHGLACSFTLPIILARYLSELSQEVSEPAVLESTLELLKGLDLSGRELTRYLPKEELRNLSQFKSEMITKGRSDNFKFAPGEEILDYVLSALRKAA